MNASWRRGAGASLRRTRSCRSSRYRKRRTSWPALIYFICVKWETELEDVSPQMKLIIIDFLPRCLGPLRDRATDYCSGCMHAGGIKEFYECEYDLKSVEFGKRIELPGGADDSHVCGAVEWLRKLGTDMKSTATQLFEALAHELKTKVPSGPEVPAALPRPGARERTCNDEGSRGIP